MGETSKNMIEQIKDAERNAQEIVQDAKNSATSLIEEARIKTNNLVKSVRQTCFNEWREKFSETEKQADAKVSKLVEDATKKKESFVANCQSAVVETANWLANEVIKAYGN